MKRTERKLVLLTEEGHSSSCISVANFILKKYVSSGEEIVDSIPLIANKTLRDRVVYGWCYTTTAGRKVECLLMSPAQRGSFVDYLAFLVEEGIPLQKHIPIAAVELTKNGFSESGNMTDQRAAKFYNIKRLYPEIDCYYFLDSEKNSNPKGNPLRALRRMKTCGIQTIIQAKSRPYEFMCEPYKDIKELVYDTQTHRTVSNSLYYSFDNKALIIETNLSKGGEMTHDPNIGWLSSILWTLRILKNKREVLISKTGLDPASLWFSFRNTPGNKLVKLVYDVCGYYPINFFGLQDGPIQPQERFLDSYWQYTSTGEKCGSILLEIDLQRLGWKTLFTNHAGCEKSFLSGKRGDLRALPKSTEFGLPDLIMLNPTGELCFIEAETSKNMSKGLKQVRAKKFKNLIDWVKKECYNNFSYQVFVSTFGEDNTGHKNVVASVKKETGNVIINNLAESVY